MATPRSPRSRLHDPDATRSPHFFFWWLLYVGFVVYGSLVPLDYQPRTWNQAWEMFQHIRLLDVGAQGRADWVANGVLYLPVGFLTASLLAGSRAKRLPILAGIGALLFALTLAVAIEFVQLHFPPRTVSLNDLIAECIGSVVGVLLATGWSHRFRAFLSELAHDPPRLASHLLTAYAIAYFAFSLFPYDFLLSLGELADKWRSQYWALLLADEPMRGGSALALAKLFGEALAAVPLGMLVGRTQFGHRAWTVAQAGVAGAALGLAIEFAQFFIVSGVSQGISVLTRAAGMAGGALLARQRAWLNPTWLATVLRRFSILLGTLYAIALMAVNGWFEHRWGNLDAALQGLQQVRFLPFYYHYYTTEQAALLSLVAVCAMYAPIGMLTWAFWSPPALATLLAILAAGMMETAKLFLANQHPDPTNLILAALAAWATAKLAAQLAQGSIQAAHNKDRSQPILHANASMDTSGDPSCQSSRAYSSLSQLGSRLRGNDEMRVVGSAPEQSRRVSSSIEEPVASNTGTAYQAPSTASPLKPMRQSDAKGYGILLIGLAVVTWGVATFPLSPPLLGLLLVGYAALIWRRPQAMLVVMPAALALIDLAPWSGRFYFDEFDLLVLTSLAVGYARLPRAKQLRDPVFFLVTALLALSYAIATVRGLLPLQWPDANAFSNYYSPYNALRIGKGALWAFLLYGLLGRLAAMGHDVRRFFGLGMVVGLAGVVAVVLWERAVFPGLLNFADVYRVTGPFSQMHIGGAEIETYLTLAVPFLVLLIYEERSWLIKTGGATLLLGTTYAVMVTFSRVGYAGYATALLISLLALLLARQSPGHPIRRSRAGGSPLVQSSHVPTLSRHDSVSRYKGIAIAIVLAALAATVSIPILQGPFAKGRLAQTGTDLATRQTHWADALRMRDPGWATDLFGMGLGRYPETHQWRSSETRAATFRLASETDNTFLRLGSGSPLYVEQFVSIRPQQDYTLSLTLRSAQPQAQLTVSLCEKWLLTSAHCAFKQIDVKSAEVWETAQITLQSGDVGDGPWYGRRPVKFSLYNANSNAVVDVDNLRLQTADGSDLLNNGAFTKRLDRWFFSVDKDLPWHAWSFPIQVFFEQGWLGLVALGLLALLAVARAGRRAWRGDLASVALFANLVGITIISILDSLVDSQRLLLLIMLLLMLGSQNTPEHGMSQDRQHQLSS